MPWSKDGFEMNMTQRGKDLLYSAPDDVLRVAAYAIAEVVVAQVAGKRVNGGPPPMPANVLDAIKAGEIGAGDIVEGFLASIGKVLMVKLAVEAMSVGEGGEQPDEPAEMDLTEALDAIAKAKAGG